MMDRRISALCLVIALCLIKIQSFLYNAVLSGDEYIVTSDVKILTYSEILVFTLSLYNSHQNLKLVRHYNITTSAGSNSFIIHPLGRQCLNPLMHIYSTEVSVYCMQDAVNNVGTRFLFDTNTLAFKEARNLAQYTYGPYSYKRSLYVSRSGSNSRLLQYFNTGVDPLPSPKSNWHEDGFATTDLIYAFGQNKLLTFYQNADFFTVRDLPQDNQLNNAYFQYYKIQLPSSGYKCVAKNPQDTFIFMVDKQNFMLKIDLNNYQIVYRKYINNMKISRCQVAGTGSSIQLIYSQLRVNDSALLSNITYLYTSNASQYASTSASIVKRRLEFFSRYTIIINLQQVFVQPSGKFCQGKGVYVNAGVCHYCPIMCMQCTSSTSCISCSVGYFYNAVTNACQKKCYGNKYMKVNHCAPCRAGCLICNQFQICLLCSPDNILNSQTKSCDSPNKISLGGSQEIHQVLQGLMQATLNNSVVLNMNRIPVSRQIFKFLFIFFGNFDDFSLYNYHERDYGRNFRTFLKMINGMETQKWQSLLIQNIQKTFNFSFQNSIDKMDRRKLYSSQSFLDIENNGQNLLSKCFCYLTKNLLSSLALFFILKILFRLLFSFRISKFLRPYSFWAYFFVIMIQGNRQLIYFLMFSQSKLLFSFNFNDKLINLAQIFFYFVFLIISIGCYFLYYNLYKKLSKYFFDNNKSNHVGALSLVMEYSLRQIILSAIHNFLREDYQLQIISLIVFQTLYICLILFYSQFKKKYISLLIIWITMTFAFLRILLNIILYLQQKNYQDLKYTNLFEEIIDFMLLIYILFYIMSILVVFLINIVSKVIDLVQSSLWCKNKRKSIVENRQLLSKKVIFEIRQDISKKKTIVQTPSEKQRQSIKEPVQQEKIEILKEEQKLQQKQKKDKKQQSKQQSKQQTKQQTKQQQKQKQKKQIINLFSQNKYTQRIKQKSLQKSSDLKVQKPASKSKSSQEYNQNNQLKKDQNKIKQKTQKNAFPQKKPAQTIQNKNHKLLLEIFSKNPSPFQK